MSYFKQVGLASLILAFSVIGFAPQVGNAQSACLDLQTNLSVGQKGTQVVSLQSFLIQNGNLVGKADGVFGNQTKNAVISFQRSKGITPLSGFVGPLTRTSIKNTTCGTSAISNTYAVDSSVSMLPNGCTTGSLYSMTTGAPCYSTNTSSAPCAPGALYNAMNGTPCGSTAVQYQQSSSANSDIASSFILQTNTADQWKDISFAEYSATTGSGCTTVSAYSSYDGNPCLHTTGAEYRVVNTPPAGSSFHHEASGLYVQLHGDWESMYAPEIKSVISGSDANEYGIVASSYKTPPSVSGFGITDLFTPLVLSHLIGQKVGIPVSVSEVKVDGVNGYSAICEMEIMGVRLWVREYLVIHNGYLHDIVTFTLPGKNMDAFYRLNENFHFTK